MRRLLKISNPSVSFDNVREILDLVKEKINYDHTNIKTLKKDDFVSLLNQIPEEGHSWNDLEKSTAIDFMVSDNNYS